MSRVPAAKSIEKVMQPMHDGRAEVGLLDDEHGRHRHEQKAAGGQRPATGPGALPRRASMSAANTTMASFISSEGWSWNGPIPIQRLEPPAK